MLPADAKITLGRGPAWDLIVVNIGKDGKFTIDALPPETFEIRVRANGFMLDADRVQYQVTRSQFWNSPARIAGRFANSARPGQEFRQRLRSPKHDPFNPGNVLPCRVGGLPLRCPSKPAGPANLTISVNGVVVNADGKPIAGANVCAAGEDQRHAILSDRPQPQPRCSGPHLQQGGAVGLDKIAIPLRLAEVVEWLLEGRPGVELLAWADGMGLTWVDITQLTPAKPQRGRRLCRKRRWSCREGQERPRHRRGAHFDQWRFPATPIPMTLRTVDLARILKSLVLSQGRPHSLDRRRGPIGAAARAGRMSDRRLRDRPRSSGSTRKSTPKRRPSLGR